MTRDGLYLPVDLGHLDWCSSRGRTYVQLYVAILRNVAVFTDDERTTIPDTSPALQHPAVTERRVAGVCTVSKSYLSTAAGMDARTAARILGEMASQGLITVEISGVARGKAPATVITVQSQAFSERRGDRGEARGEQIKREEESEKKNTKSAPHPPKKPDRIWIQLPLKDGTLFDIKESYVEELAETFPSVDVRDQLRRAVQWGRDNEANRKTKRGAKRFLSGWVSRASKPYRPRWGDANDQTDDESTVCPSCGEGSDGGYCDICKKAVAG